MKTRKKIIANMPKCYSICPITVRGIEGFLIATEKLGECNFFDLDGNLVETVWSEPGGVMTMVPVPDGDGAFLSTQRFFSPNDSKDAQIVLAAPVKQGWDIRPLVALPFVHRFDILTIGAEHYVIACSLKSDHEFKNDWNHPGKIYVGKLDDALKSTGGLHQGLTVLKDGLTHNHGYYRGEEKGVPFSVICADEGIFRVDPPCDGKDWKVEKISPQATSDAVLFDLDGDGEMELITLSPFHGDHLDVFRKRADRYERVYSSPHVLEFLHGIHATTIKGVPTVLIGNRKGERKLFALQWNTETKQFKEVLIDKNVGPANCNSIEKNGKSMIISTNREIDEVALYDVLD